MVKEDSGSAVDDAVSDAPEDGGTLDHMHSDVSSDDPGAFADASLVAAPTDPPSFFPTPAVDFLSSGLASGRSSFSAYLTPCSSLTDGYESDSAASHLSHSTPLSRSLLPPEIEQIEESYHWLRTPTAKASTASVAPRSRDAVQRQKFKRQWLLELRSKRDRLEELLNKLFTRSESISWLGFHKYDNGLLEPISRARLIHKDASDLMSKIQAGSIFFLIFRANIFKLVSQLDEAIQDLSWLTHLFEHDSGHNEDGQLVPPLALNEPGSFLGWSLIAKVYHASSNDKLRKALISITPNHELFSGNRLRLSVRVFCLLLPVLQCKTVIDSFSPTWRPMIYAISWRDLLKQNDTMVGAMAAYAISELAAIGLAVQNEFVEKDFIPILVEHLTSFYESRMVRKQIEAHARASAMVARALWNICKGNPSHTMRIVGSKLLSICLTKLSDLGDESRESRNASVELLMEIANLFRDEDDSLRQFFTAVYSKDAKGICENLRSIANEGVQGDNFPNIVPRIIAFTCLSKVFNDRWYYDIYFYEGWEITGTLIHILETRYPGIVGEETAVMLSQNIPVRSLIHDLEILPPELVIICCITKYVVAFEEPESMLDIRILLECASEEKHLTKDATIKRLMHEAKSKLDKI